MSFDPWQDGAGKLILAKRADGSYAASIGGVVLSIPRQVGKTYLLGAIVFALCLLNPGLTVLWTAHRLRTADETFAKMQAFARKAKVRAHIAKVVLGSGDEEIKFHNGSRILFGARERGFGRGFDDVDVEVFDEAQILTENAVDDMIPAMNTAANPLPIFIGTPPKPKDPSEVFTQKRADALAGDEDTAYIEFSADRNADPEDRKQWAKANPSFPARTPESAMLRMKKNLTAESFLREGLGIWDEDNQAPWGFIPKRNWLAGADTEGADEDWFTGPPSLGIEQPTSDRSLVSITATGDLRNGDHGVFVVAQVTPDQLDATLSLLANDEAHPIRNTVADPNSPAGAFIERDADGKNPTIGGVPILEINYRELKAATGDFHDAAVAEQPTIHHRDQPILTHAVGRTTMRRSGDVDLIDRRADPAYAPVLAAVLARHGHMQPVAGPAPMLIF